MRYSPLLALAMGNVAMAQFSNSTTTSSSATSTTTGTVGPTNNPSVGFFRFYGCVGSSNGFPTFELEVNTDMITQELCASSCASSDWFGLYGE